MAHFQPVKLLPLFAFGLPGILVLRVAEIDATFSFLIAVLKKSSVLLISRDKLKSSCLLLT